MPEPTETIEFIPFPGQDKIFLSKARFIFASAGQRSGKCCSPDTLISGQRLDSFGFKKGTAPLYSLNGSLRATAGHRVLSPTGWTSVGDLLSLEPDRRFVFQSIPLESSLAHDLLTLLVNAPNYWKTIQDFQSDYLAYFRSNGGRPRPDLIYDPNGAPSQDDALSRKVVAQYESKHTHLCQSSGLLSKKGDLPLSCHLSEVSDEDSSPGDLCNSLNILKIPVSALPKELRDRVFRKLDHQQLSYISFIYWPNSKVYSFAVSVKCDIKQDKTEDYWDTSVPLIHAYEAGGFINHNTKAGCYWANIQMNIPGTNGMICANTIDQLNASVLDKFWQEFPQLKKFYNGKYKQMNLPNGSKVYMRSLDNPEMIRGLNLHWIWPDEIDGQNMNTWKILEGRVSNTLGRILGTSSIYRRSFVHEMYKLHKHDPDYEFITWKSKDNPSFPAAEYDRLQRTWDPIDFAREFGGEFSFATGQVYPIQEDHIIDKIPENVKVLTYVYGLDYGINDPNVITVNMFCDDGNWYIGDEYYQPNMSIQEINHWLQYFIDKYKQRPYATCQDPAGGIARNSLISAARPVDAIKQILERTKLIRNLIYQGKIYVLKKCVNTCREFEYHMFDMKNPELPEDKNNHCMDSFGYALHTTWDQIQGKAKNTEEKPLSPFWQRKKELYKTLQSSDNDNIEFKREADSWSEY